MKHKGGLEDKKNHAPKKNIDGKHEMVRSTLFGNAEQL